ncbi:hypothetical protein J6590_100735, partial [Homalodisca vitripennis]
RFAASSRLITSPEATACCVSLTTGKQLTITSPPPPPPPHPLAEPNINLNAIHELNLKSIKFAET